jgi:hypothetical protein
MIPQKGRPGLSRAPWGQVFTRLTHAVYDFLTSGLFWLFGERLKTSQRRG